MRLVTRCPACATTFKVVRDQLRISEGWVRCGRCSEVFDATQALWETHDDGTPAAPPPAAVAAPAPQADRPTSGPSGPDRPGSDPHGEPPAEEVFDLGPDLPASPADAPPPPAPAHDWPKADLLDLGARAPAPAMRSEPRAHEPAVWAPGGMAVHFGGGVPLEPRFDALPSLDLGAAPGQPGGRRTERREPAFSVPLTAPTPAVSPIEEAVNAQLQKALRRERVNALRRERAQRREHERERDGMPAAGEPSLDGAQVPTPGAADAGRPAVHDAAPDDRQAADSPALRLPSAPAAPAPADASDAPDAPDAPDARDAPDAAMPLPSFATPDAPRRARAGAWLWALACLAAAALLVLQYVRHERDMLLARQPQLRPALQALCDWTGCRLAAPRVIAAISIEGASFAREAGEGYRLVFTLRNGARVPLAMPAVELTLLDTQERALVRRVLQPAEYGAPAVIAAGAERSTSLPVRLAGPDAAGLSSVAGYRLVAFYP